MTLGCLYAHPTAPAMCSTSTRVTPPVSCDKHPKEGQWLLTSSRDTQLRRLLAVVPHEEDCGQLGGLATRRKVAASPAEGRIQPYGSAESQE